MMLARIGDDLGLVWRKVNCHAKGCLRVGLHHVDGTPYTTCKKHHPVHPGSRAVTADQIARAHAAAHAAAEAELAGASSGPRTSADLR